MKLIQMLSAIKIIFITMIKDLVFKQQSYYLIQEQVYPKTHLLCVTIQRSSPQQMIIEDLQTNFLGCAVEMNSYLILKMGEADVEGIKRSQELNCLTFNLSMKENRIIFKSNQSLSGIKYKRSSQTLRLQICR